MIESYSDTKIFSPSHIERSKGEKVCGMDLDDVLADSIPSWIKFANTMIVKMKPYSQVKYEWMREYQDLYDLKKSIPYY